MSTRGWIRAIGKEVRAVAPIWGAVALAMTAVKAPHGAFQSILQSLGALSYFIGPAAVGALSVGHEFNNRTWPLLLTQPVSRQRLMLAKLGVVVVLALALYGVALELSVAPLFREFSPKVMWLPVVLGIFVAPWLTLIVRRAIGGAVFASAIPGALLVAGQTLGVKVFGYTTDVDRFANAVVFWGVVTACVAGAVFGWRSFVRLEVASDDAGRAQAAVPKMHSAHRTAVARGNPVVKLVTKELRLQSLTLTIAGCYVVVYVVSVLTAGGRPLFWTVAVVLTVVYASLLSMIAGAVASAEERQIATLDSQLLLPMAVRWQWVVKAATVVGLALALGYEMPRLLVWILPPESRAAATATDTILSPVFALVVVMFAAISLYVSSVCRGTLSALIFALPVYALTVVLIREIVDPVTHTAFNWIHVPALHALRSGAPSGTAVIAAVVALLASLVVGLALPNHRYADRSVSRIVAHAALFVVAVTAGLATLAALSIQ